MGFNLKLSSINDTVLTTNVRCSNIFFNVIKECLNVFTIGNNASRILIIKKFRFLRSAILLIWMPSPIELIAIKKFYSFTLIKLKFFRFFVAVHINC